MPYSGPSSTTTTTTIGSRPGHRRSYSSSFSDEKGPGAFAPMGSLPRRGSGLRSTPPTPKVFHLKGDDDSSSSEESTVPSQHKRTPGFHENYDDDEDSSLPPLKFKQPSTGAFRLHLNTKLQPTVHLGVPFPRSSPSPSPQSASPPPEHDSFPTPPPVEVVSQSPDPISTPVPRPSALGYLASPQPRPNYNRTASSPVLLANGKPLKSSLKSSSSSPNVTIPAVALQPEQRPMHLRARSEPATPRLDILSSSSSSSSTASPMSTTASTPKNVHFSTTDLAQVKLFNKAAKPASLLGEETETETEGESSVRSLWRSGGYPFPRVAKKEEKTETKFELDLGSYPIPSTSPSPHANVHLEAMSLVSTGTPPSLSLTGTVVVRNVAFEKNVFVRFTLDDWQTTSEVSAKYVESFPTLPSTLLPRTFGDIIASQGGDSTGWDRFTFSIRLEDYMRGLETKVIWMVGRFYAPQHGSEWWDNNGGRNYRVAFRKVLVPMNAPAAPATEPYQLPRAATHPPRSPARSVSTNSPRQAVAEATEKRLSRFSFGANYARPAIHTQESHATGEFSAEKLTEALTSLSENEGSESSPVSKSRIPGQGITLTLPLKRPAQVEQNSLTFPRLPGSPRSPSPVSGLPVPELVRRTGSNLSTSTTDTDDEELKSPLEVKSADFGDIEHLEHSSPDVDVVVTPKMEDVKSPIVSLPPQVMMSPTAMDSDSLYKAFVDRWCFATAEGAAPGSDVGIEI